MILFKTFQTIIARNYRGDLDMSVIDKFMTLLMDREEVSFCLDVLVIFYFFRKDNCLLFLLMVILRSFLSSIIMFIVSAQLCF